jgi:hypothetical protein
MEFDGLKGKLERHLAHSVHKGVWRYMCTREAALLKEVEQGRLPFAEFVDRYQVDVEIITEGEIPRRTRNPRLLTTPADRRLETLARIACIEASRDVFVESFRREHLQGRLLTPEDAPRWIKSHEMARPRDLTPLAVELPVGDVTDVLSLGIHQELLSWWDDPANDPDWPRAMEMGLEAGVRTAWSQEDYADLLEDVARKVRAGEVEVPLVVRKRDSLPYRDGDAVIGDSLPLLDLKDAVAHLISWIPWTEKQAVEFLLTGAPQTLLRATLETRLSRLPALRRVTLVVDPRMPGRELATFYEAGRRTFARGRDKPMSEKSLELAVFCTERMLESNKWSELREDWNAIYPAWVYKPDDDVVGRRFARDARDAYERVVGRKFDDSQRVAKERGFELDSLTLSLLEQGSGPTVRLEKGELPTLPHDHLDLWKREFESMRSRFEGEGDEGTS